MGTPWSIRLSGSRVRPKTLKLASLAIAVAEVHNAGPSIGRRHGRVSSVQVTESRTCGARRLVAPVLSALAHRDDGAGLAVLASFTSYFW